MAHPNIENDVPFPGVRVTPIAAAGCSHPDPGARAGVIRVADGRDSSLPRGLAAAGHWLGGWKGRAQSRQRKDV